MLLALGACYINVIFREAAKRKIDVRGVDVEMQGDWDGDPIRAQKVTYSARVEARAPEVDIREPIAHTDRGAEVHNSLRMGTHVTLVNVQAVSVE